MNKFNSFVAGAFLGGLISSVLVLLFTPYSGAELQNNVSDYIDNVRNEVEKAGADKRKELETQLEDLRSGKI